MISDDAVMVATVAEPVARRISTAISQASTSTEKLAPSAQRASSGADAGVDQHLLEAAAGGDDQDDAGDRRQTRLDALGDLVAAHAGAPAEGEHADDDGDAAARSAGCRAVSKICRNHWFSSSMKMSTSALPSISTTGSSTLNSVMPKDGRRARFCASVGESDRRRSVSGALDDDPSPGQLPEQRARDDDRRDRDQRHREPA